LVLSSRALGRYALDTQAATMRILNLSYVPVPNLPEHEVIHRSVKDLGPNGWLGLIREAQAFGPELIIEREFNDGVALYEPLYRAFPEVPKVWWWIDAHVLYEFRKPYATNFNYLFLAVSRYVPKAEGELGIKSFWLPLSCPWEASACVPNDRTRDLDVTFIARIEPIQFFGRRIECITRLRQSLGERFYFATNYHDMRSLVQRSKVSLNCAFHDDLNFRCFEVLGCGTELVTDAVSDLYNVPGLAERVAIYRTADEMAFLVTEVLEGRVQHNMTAVQDWIRNHHCIEHRYREMIAQLRKEKAVPA
jgi:hypothetical protein